MRRDWSDPYALEPRPNHTPTHLEREEFMERLEGLALIGSHIGITFNIDLTFGPTRKRRARPSGSTDGETT